VIYDLDVMTLERCSQSLWCMVERKRVSGEKKPWLIIRYTFDHAL
jgi:hypothetical protein